MTMLFRSRRRRARAGHLVFTVYTRRACCCCDKAIALLQQRQRRAGFRIELVDVDEDPELAAVAAAWPALPAAIRAGILAMVRAAGGTQPG